MKHRVLRLTVAGVAALVATGTILSMAPAALADTADTGGTSTITVPESVVRTEAARGVAVTPADGATATYDRTKHTVTFSFAVSGGDADVANFTGSLHHTGSLVLTDVRNHRRTKATDITLNYLTNTVDATLTGSAAPVSLLDLDGQGTFSNDGTTQTYTAASADVDTAGAAAVNTAVRVSAFTAGQSVGAFATSYTISRS